MSEQARSSWAPVDLRDVVSGGYVHPPPTVLARDDGICLFYRRLLHWVQGEPESLKGWFVQLGAAQELAAGHHVMYLDFEDSEHGIIPRMSALGARTDALVERFHYIRPSEPLDDDGLAELGKVLTLGPTLAVVDGVTDAMAVHDLNPEKNADVAKFHRGILRPLVDSGPATAVVDHVIKDREKRGNWAIGGQHKKGALRGAAYNVDLVAPFGYGRHGIAKITVAKDTPGRVREHAADGGKHIADLHLQSEPDRTVLAELRPPPKSDSSQGEPSLPKEHMERISRFLEQLAADAPGYSASVIEDQVKGKAATLRVALQALANLGYVTSSRGAPKLYRSVRPYREIVVNMKIPGQR